MRCTEKGPMEASKKPCAGAQRTRLSPCNWSWWHRHSQPTLSPCWHMGHTDNQSSASSLPRQRNKSAKRTTRLVLETATEISTRRQLFLAQGWRTQESLTSEWEEGKPKRMERPLKNEFLSILNKFLLLPVPSSTGHDGKQGTKEWITSLRNQARDIMPVPKS